MNKLWCVNVWGPDDLYAMRDKATALERANELNIAFGRRPRHEYDPIMLAVVVEWPGPPESHAQDLAAAERLMQPCKCGAGTMADCMANTCAKVQAAAREQA
jgi:hypothetical protein